MIARSIRTALLGAGLLLGCHSSQQAAGETEGPTSRKPIPVVSVTQVASWLHDKKAVAVDANDAETRSSQGVVPGAVLLSSARKFDASELPGAKGDKFVFYCGGEKCRASDAAANRARDAGYTDVNIMRAGIRGWKSAGEPTAAPRS